jgi:hypothetical protein
MRLAEHEKLVRKAKSIRGARDLLPKAQPRGTPKPLDADKPSGGFEQKPPASTFEDEVQARAPDEVFPVLVEHWEDDDLRKLVKLINDHLTKKTSSLFPKPSTTTPISNAVTNSPTPPTPDLSIPPTLRRDLATKTA